MTTADRSAVSRHPIRVVAERTGLSADVLRAWEKRYDAVEPERSDHGQRLYSDADIERLRMIAEAVRSGRSVAQVARLDLDALRALLRDDEANRPPASQEARHLIDAAYACTASLDDQELERLLRRGVVALGVDAFFEDVLAPLLRQIGDGWRLKALTPAHEHMASGVVRRVLDWVMASGEPTSHSPILVATTPPHELHEIGALLAATVAALEGWQVRYLGPNLPATDLVRAARQAGARAAAISAISLDRASLVSYLVALRRQLDPTVTLFVGGAAALKLPAAAGRTHTSLRDFKTDLAVLRKSVSP